MGNRQACFGFRPGFWQEPDPAPEASLEQHPPQPVNAVADYADLPFWFLPAVAMLGRQRFGRRPQVARAIPRSLASSTWCRRPGQQGDHREHQPVAGDVSWIGAPGLVPLPAEALDGLEAQFDPETEGVPTGSHLIGCQVGEGDPGFLLLGVPDHQQGSAALDGGMTEGGAAPDPGRVGNGDEGRAGRL